MNRLAIYHDGDLVHECEVPTYGDLCSALDAHRPPHARGSVAVLTTDRGVARYLSGHSIRGPVWTVQ